jgi:hypothetical protein
MVVDQALGAHFGERAMRTPEAAIKKQIREWLRQEGAYIFSPVQMGYGASTLDLLVCWKGRFVAIEVKAEGKKLTPRQELLTSEIRAAGGRAFTAYSVDDVARALA